LFYAYQHKTAIFSVFLAKTPLGRLGVKYFLYFILALMSGLDFKGISSTPWDIQKMEKKVPNRECGTGVSDYFLPRNYTTLHF